MKYTLKSIHEETGVSIQSLYKFINRNKERFNGHITKNKQGVYYDEYAYSLFLKHYRPDDEPQEAVGSSETEADGQIPESQNEKALEWRISQLEEQLKKIEQDRDAWKEQAGQALLALGKEQEFNRMLNERLLPAPKEHEQDSDQKQETEKKHGLFWFLRHRK